MKKTLWISITTFLIIIFVISACQAFQKAPEVDPASQTQVAIFAQATLTKFAEQAPQATPTVLGFPIAITNEEPTEQPSQPTADTPTEEAPTAEPTEEPVAPTAVPPTAEPTAVPQPTSPANLPEPPAGTERISFAAGTTNKTVSGTVEANQSKRYSVWMSKYQMLNIATTADNAAYISVKSPSGKVLVPFENRWLWYSDFAQESGDYVIEVSGMAYKSSYQLWVAIPQALQFEQGSTSLTAKASVPANSAHNFIFWANVNQNMTISLSQPDKFIVTVMHADGTYLQDYNAKKNTFDGTLPKAGNYVVSIYNTTGETVAVDFNLTIK